MNHGRPLLFPTSDEEPLTPLEHEASTSRASANVQGRKAGPTQMSGAHFQIISSCLAATLPIILLAAALLTLVYIYRLPTAASPNQEGSTFATQTCKYGLYVNYSATRLTFIASLISTAAAYMSFPIMTLASYPVSRGLIKDSRRSSQTALPSSYQTNLLVGLLAGGVGSLWNSTAYLVFWRRKRVSAYRAIISCVSILGMMLAMRYA
jgi:hypothetical protein